MKMCDCCEKRGRFITYANGETLCNDCKQATSGFSRKGYYDLQAEVARLREQLKASEERRLRQGAEITAGAQEQIGMINAECVRLEQRLAQQEMLALQLCDAVENEDNLPPTRFAVRCKKLINQLREQANGAAMKKDAI